MNLLNILTSDGKEEFLINNSHMFIEFIFGSKVRCHICYIVTREVEKYFYPFPNSKFSFVDEVNFDIDNTDNIIIRFWGSPGIMNKLIVDRALNVTKEI